MPLQRAEADGRERRKGGVKPFPGHPQAAVHSVR